MRFDMEPAALVQKNNRIISVAMPRGRLDERIEHRLKIEGRAANDLEHVGSGGLLLERLPQFVEQPRVLDGDDGLSGEVCNQRDLLVGERPDLDPPNRDDADDPIFSQHRHSEDGPMHLLVAAVVVGPPILGIGENIVNVYDATLHDGPPRRRTSILTDRASLGDFFEFS
ncbi:MAG: hypothetical protein WAR76_24835 [Xanthobacteraceae bacterium]